MTTPTHLTPAQVAEEIISLPSFVVKVGQDNLKSAITQAMEGRDKEHAAQLAKQREEMEKELLLLWNDLEYLAKNSESFDRMRHGVRKITYVVEVNKLVFLQRKIARCIPFINLDDESKNCIKCGHEHKQSHKKCICTCCKNSI